MGWEQALGDDISIQRVLGGILGTGNAQGRKRGDIGIPGARDTPGAESLEEARPANSILWGSAEPVPVWPVRFPGIPWCRMLCCANVKAWEVFFYFFSSSLLCEAAILPRYSSSSSSHRCGCCVSSVCYFSPVPPPKGCLAVLILSAILPGAPAAST